MRNLNLRQLESNLNRALADEEGADDLFMAWRLAKRSERALRLLREAQAEAAKPRTCGCGCGGIVRRTFLPGHDMKLKSRLRSAK